MIAVMMRRDDPMDVAGTELQAEEREAGCRKPRAHASVDEDPRPTRFDEERVSARSTSEHESAHAFLFSGRARVGKRYRFRRIVRLIREHDSLPELR
jgi:hypothetical protein